MKIELWPIDRAKDYPKNARKWSPAAIEKVAASIREFGFVQPVVVDKHDVIIIGHLRRASARTIPLTHIPVHVADNLSPAQVRQLRLMDNRSHEEAQWDPDILTAEMLDLRGLDLDLSLTGFTQRELDALLRVDNPAEDDVPPVPVAPVTRAGDLWLLGEHRVLCGDSTSVEAVARLLGGQKAPFLMVTDPPYGVEYDPNWRNESETIAYGATAVNYIEGDHKADWVHAHQLFPGDVAYVWCASWYLPEVGLSLASIGFERRSLIIWKKPAITISRGHYNWQHEPCWYCVKKGKTAHWHGDHNASTIWEVPVIDGQDRTGHAAQKPVELMRRPILNHTETGSRVYDPFLGSGTTLIAAESTERICYGLEISPAFCDVIVTRWQNLTGKEATLEGHGATFSHVRDGRRLEAADAIGEEVLERLGV